MGQEDTCGDRACLSCRVTAWGAFGLAGVCGRGAYSIRCATRLASRNDGDANVAESGPTSVEMGPTPVEFGQVLAKGAQIQSKLDQTRNRPKLGRFGAEFDRTRPTSPQDRPNLARVRSNSTNTCQIWDVLERAPVCARCSQHVRRAHENRTKEIVTNRTLRALSTSAPLAALRASGRTCAVQAARRNPEDG